MRTTLDLNDELLAAAKARAAEARISLTAFIESSLRAALDAQRSAQTAAPPSVIHGKGGLREGIDSTSNHSLLNSIEDDCA